MLRITPSQATLGARIETVDLSSLADAEWKHIEEAFFNYAVLVFPDQHLARAEQVTFSQRFGPLERLITKNASDPNIGVLTNVGGDGKVVPPGGKVDLFLKGNTFWHTDSSYKPVPAGPSLLSAQIVPKQGGQTQFADMRAAWDALSDSERTSLDGLEAVHSYRYSQGLVGGLDILTDEEWNALPPVVQPLVRTHPATGRKSLYIGRHASHIVGREEAQGRTRLERLLENACQPPRIFEHRWVAGDLVVWDNRCVLHRGRPWPADEPRVMHRTTVAGDGANSWTL